MQALSATQIKNKRKRINFKSIKETTFDTDSKQKNFSGFVVFASKIATIPRLKFFGSRLN